MSDPVEAKGKLRELADDLDACSKMMSRVNRELRPLQAQYDDFVCDFKAGLWAAHVNEDARLPSADMQLVLALREMPAEFRGKHYDLVGKRDNLRKRISDLKSEVDAWRSVLSADKTEMEAIGA